MAGLNEHEATGSILRVDPALRATDVPTRIEGPYPLSLQPGRWYVLTNLGTMHSIATRASRQLNYES